MECFTESLERYALRFEEEKDPAYNSFESVLFYAFQTFWEEGIISAENHTALF